jgi:hypothetical protein
MKDCVESNSGTRTYYYCRNTREVSNRETGYIKTLINMHSKSNQVIKCCDSTY